MHGSWSQIDEDILVKLRPDAVLFVGDLGEGDLKIVQAIKSIPLPVGVILGNHDRGKDGTGETLEKQLNLLGDLHCGWKLRNWENSPFALIGARPCSSGGGFYLSPEVRGFFGPITIEDSVKRMVSASKMVPKGIPMVLLAHAGPTGLGSDQTSICGRDWKSPALDWGDKDLALALDQISNNRKLQLVVFGHMHHQLNAGSKIRETFLIDRRGIAFLNAACVPRVSFDESGNTLHHFSWVEFVDDRLNLAAHRWYLEDASVAYQETLYKKSN